MKVEVEVEMKVEVEVEMKVEVVVEMKVERWGDCNFRRGHQDP